MTALASPALPRLALQRRALPKPALRTRLDEQLLVAHLDVMYRVALSICGSPQEAQDIVQDVCVKVAVAPARCHARPRAAYLLTAVRNIWYDRLRARAARPQRAALADHPDVLASPLPEPAELVDNKRVYAAIAQLSEPHRLVVTSIDVAGLSYAEAAELLDVPVGTVMSRLHRARSRLAALLQPA